MNSRYSTLLVAVLLVASLVGPAAIGAGAATTSDNMTTVDTDHPVASDAAVETFQEDGLTSGHAGAVDLEITVAEHSEDVGVESAFETDFNAVYLRVEYNETIDRSVRFYIPKEVWYPHQKDATTPIDGTTEADFGIAEDGEYTAVTVHFEGETDAVYRVSKEAATIFKLRSESSSFVENVTGYEMPTLMSSTDWQYPDNAFSTNESTVAFEHNDSLVVEYDSDDVAGRERWVNVPSCDSSSGSDAPVCAFEREGVDNTTYVTARTGEPPAIRYTDDRSLLDSFRSTVVNDLEAALDGMHETASSYMPGMIQPASNFEVTPW